jgi:hypothetical protein
MKDGIRKLVYDNNGKETEIETVPSKTIYLKSSWGSKGNSSYSFSLNGITFQPVGDPY